MRRTAAALLLALLFSGAQHSAEAGVRDHTRPAYFGSTRLSPDQAAALSLSRGKVGLQELQTWFRIAGRFQGSDRSRLWGRYCGPELDLIRPGQRVRLFYPALKSAVYQGRVGMRSAGPDCVSVRVDAPRSLPLSWGWVMEIIVPRGRTLAVPNEAIIHEAGRQIVYVEHHPGHYLPRIIETGIVGELFTQVTDGLEAGEVIVTTGSFFVDAEYKLQRGGGSHAHSHH